MRGERWVTINNQPQKTSRCDRIRRDRARGGEEGGWGYRSMNFHPSQTSTTCNGQLRFTVNWSVGRSNGLFDSYFQQVFKRRAIGEKEKKWKRRSLCCCLQLMAASSSLSFCLVSWRSKATDEKTERERIWLVPSSRFKLHSFLLLFPIILFIVARVLLLLQRTHKSKTTTRRRPSRRL